MKEHIADYSKEEVQSSLINIPFSEYENIGGHLSKTVEAAEQYLDSLIKQLPYYKYKVKRAVGVYRKAKEDILEVFPEDENNKLEKAV